MQATPCSFICGKILDFIRFKNSIVRKVYSAADDIIGFPPATVVSLASFKASANPLSKNVRIIRLRTPSLTGTKTFRQESAHLADASPAMEVLLKASQLILISG